MSAPFVCIDCDEPIYNPLYVYQYLDEWGDLVHPVCYPCYNLGRGLESPEVS